MGTHVGVCEHLFWVLLGVLGEWNGWATSLRNRLTGLHRAASKTRLQVRYHSSRSSRRGGVSAPLPWMRAGW